MKSYTENPDNARTVFYLAQTYACLHEDMLAIEMFDKRSRMENGFWEHECISCGNALQKVATDEDSKLDPQSIYGITKLTQEQMVLAFGRAHGLSVYALRLQNVYGPGQSLSNPYTGILSVFSTRILTNSTIHVYEDGLESRDFVYISDVIDAF